MNPKAQWQKKAQSSPKKGLRSEKERRLGCASKTWKVSKHGPNDGPKRKNTHEVRDRAHWPTLGYGQCMGDDHSGMALLKE